MNHMEEISLIITIINSAQIEHWQQNAQIMSKSIFQWDRTLTVRLKHKKCLVIVFQLNAQIEPTLIMSYSFCIQIRERIRPFLCQPVNSSVLKLVYCNTPVSLSVHLSWICLSGLCTSYDRPVCPYHLTLGSLWAYLALPCLFFRLDFIVCFKF